MFLRKNKSIKIEFDNKGASLILAIFMIVVFAIIGVAILTMLTTSTISSSEDLISTQAFFMAESGAEIKIKEVIHDGDTSPKVYHFNNFTINTNVSSMSASGKIFYHVKSAASKYNIKRTIVVKFW